MLYWSLGAMKSAVSKVMITFTDRHAHTPYLYQYIKDGNIYHILLLINYFKTYLSATSSTLDLPLEDVSPLLHEVDGMSYSG